MSKYFKKPEQKYDSWDELNRKKQESMYVALGAASAGALYAFPASMVAGIIMKTRTPSNPQDVDNFIEKVKKSHNLNTSVIKGKLSMDFFDPKANTISLSEDASPAVAAHELGHARYKDYHLPSIARVLPITGGLMSGVLLKDNKTKNYAAPVFVASSLPLIYDEARASVVGYNSLKKFYTGPDRVKVLNDAKKLLPAALGTYIAPAAIGGLLLHFYSKSRPKSQGSNPPKILKKYHVY